MTAPRNLVEAARPSGSVAFTQQELRVIEAMRQMDDWRRNGIERIAGGFARDFPRRAAALRLVSGGAS